MIYKLLTLTLIFVLISLIFIADIGRGVRLTSYLLSVPHGDKFLHLFLMGIITALLNITLRFKKTVFFGKTLLFGSIIMAIGITIEEFSQAFNPYRHFEILDLVSNYLGIFVIGQIPAFLLAHFPKTMKPFFLLNSSN